MTELSLNNMEYTYPLFWPYMNNEIKNEVMETLGTRWLGQGPMVDNFEQSFREKIGCTYPVSVNSATSALELAYHLLELKEGDEVISPVLTCSATNIPLVRRGVKVVFADIYKNTLTIDWNDVAKKITRKTKAIIAVNLGGIDATGGNDYFLGVPIITDSAQSLAKTSGYMVVYSFQAIKHITTGDGGMLCLTNEEDYKRAKKLRWYGIDREERVSAGFNMYKLREMTMNIYEPGYKYHMNDIAATMGIVGLDYLDVAISHRRRLFEEYRKNLKDVKGITIIDGPNNSYWLFTILVEKRGELANKLKESSIETNLVQLRNDIYSVFGGKKLNLKNMNEIEDKYISLPLNPKITKKDVQYICEQISYGW